MTTTAAVLVPVKAFANAKQRLADVLDPAARVALAMAMADTVLRGRRPAARRGRLRRRRGADLGRGARGRGDLDARAWA